MWMGPFRWENIPGWRLRLAMGFLLSDYPLLFPLLWHGSEPTFRAKKETLRRHGPLPQP